MIRVSIKGDVIKLRQLRAIGRDATPIMQSIGTVLLNVVRGMFYSHGASYRPVPWAPKADGSPSTLKKTGRLSASFTLSYDAHKATVTTDAPYAAVHQFGFSGTQHVPEHQRRVTSAFGRDIDPPAVWDIRAHDRNVSIPARPFFPVRNGDLTPEVKVLVERAAERALTRTLHS